MSSLPPVPRTIYERAVLFDTCALEALVDQYDKYHQDAVQCLQELQRMSYPFYVTTFTIAETHRRLLYKPRQGIAPALNFLEGVYDGAFNIVRPDEEDERQGLAYIERFTDQKLTVTDSVSMAVMKRLGLRKVFSFDWHFTLLGFQTIPTLA
ncbi:MAG: PIN domain-containing protein [Anaerolineae bacterium]|nr:PIN domain-containing protein [Anaerolineae bacterium]